MNPAEAAPPSQAAIATARSLAVDLVTAEAMAAFQSAGIDALLLKGPSIASWLYSAGAARTYVDTDLLVEPSGFATAEAVLRELGFAPRLEPHDTPGWRRPSREWLRAADRANVDLHRTLAGVEAEPAVLWSLLAAGSDRIRVGGRYIPTLGVTARALHVALHAAQHGATARTALEDLRRAIELLDDATWGDVAALAAVVDARGALAAGLGLLPQGAALVRRLDLPAPSVETRLLASTPPPAAVAFVHFSELDGAAARVHFVARKIVPSRRYIRAWSPLARRGRRGLVFAYLWRPVWLLLNAPGGYRAWARARRDTPSRAC